MRVKAASDASREARAKLEATRSLQAYLDRIGLLRLGASGSAEWERFLGAIPDEMTSDIISAD